MQLLEDAFLKQLNEVIYDITRGLWFRLWLHFDYSFYYLTLLENTDNLFLL